jgi:hypothetical protein
MSNELPKVEAPITPSAFLSDASPVSSRFWVAPSRAFFWQRFTNSLPCQLMPRSREIFQIC